MKSTRREFLRPLAGAFLGAAATNALGFQPNPAAWSDAEKEKFLKAAALVSVEEIGHGVTKPIKAKLMLAGVEHSAKIQTVDKELPDFFGADNKPVPMRDSWRYNVAAYRMDRLLGLRMATVEVARPFRGKPAAYSWWVDDVQFEEVERLKKEIQPPDPADFARQRELSKVFDELIINIDRNLSNIIITKVWKIALIDHSRCFVPYNAIRNTENLTRCSKGLLAAMRALTAASITQAVGTYLTAAEVKGCLARRDRIVEFFAREVTAKGEASVLFP